MELEQYVLMAFNNSNPNRVDKLWLKNQLDSYYDNNDEEIISDRILDYFETYLEKVEKNIIKRTKSRYKTSLEFTKRFLSESEFYNDNATLSEIDVDFHKCFEDYGIENSYSINTISKYFSTIKTMCNHAHDHYGIQLSHKFNLIKLKSKRGPIIYLSLDELKLIKNIDNKLLGDRLTNVRDWLLISCFTGQRISDFMNFSIDNVRHQDEFSVMDIFQEKGKKSVTIPILDEVIKTMKRYDGGFPRQLSDQKYNDYVKEVVKLAGIDEITYGGVAKVVPGIGKRKIMGDYPKYELISSHVGRRSFATNFYGRMKTPWLMNITGHVKESTFLAYIGKTSKDTAIEAAREFKKLNIEL